MKEGNALQLTAECPALPAALGSRPAATDLVLLLVLVLRQALPAHFVQSARDWLPCSARPCCLGSEKGPSHRERSVSRRPTSTPSARQTLREAKTDTKKRPGTQRRGHHPWNSSVSRMCKQESNSLRRSDSESRIRADGQPTLLCIRSSLLLLLDSVSPGQINRLSQSITINASALKTHLISDKMPGV